MNYLKDRKGFTLIEMLVVVGIIGVLASLVLVGLGGARTSGQDARKISNLNQIRNSLELYYLAEGSYPGGTDVAVNGIANLDLGRLTLDDTYRYSVDSPSYVIAVDLDGENAGGFDEDPGSGAFAIGSCATSGVYCLTAD